VYKVSLFKMKTFGGLKSQPSQGTSRIYITWASSFLSFLGTFGSTLPNAHVVARSSKISFGLILEDKGCKHDVNAFPFLSMHI
jgi:hypothetical protein